MLGFGAGREFIGYVNAYHDGYVNDFKPKVAVIWNLTSGPSVDFILGQICANRVNDVYEKFGSDWEQKKMMKQDMYRKKNYALLGK